MGAVNAPVASIDRPGLARRQATAAATRPLGLYGRVDQTGGLATRRGILGSVDAVAALMLAR